MRKWYEKRMNKLTVLCLTVCMIATLAGCGSSAYYSESAANDSAPMAMESYSTMDVGGNYMMEDAVVEEELGYEEADSSVDVNDNAANAQNSRKLIRTVDMSIETKEFDLVLSTLEEQINALGGYIERMDTYNGSAYSYYRGTRNADMTVRIPKDRLDGFLETVSEISNVVSRSENVEDVTLTYVDLESRKSALSTEQSRLLELLEKAESIEDIITIEQRLSNVRYELESMESQLRTYDNKVDYSTVYLYIDEVEELTPVVEESAWERMVNGFIDSLQDIGEGFKEFGIWFVVHIPYLVIWGIIITVAVVVIKKLRKRRHNRKETKAVQAADTQNTSETQK